MGLTEGYDTEKDFMEAFFRQGEFDHKVNNPFLNFVSAVLDITIIKPLYEVATGEDISLWCLLILGKYKIIIKFLR